MEKECKKEISTEDEVRECVDLLFGQEEEPVCGVLAAKSLARMAEEYEEYYRELLHEKNGSCVSCL